MALFKILKGNEANLPSDKHEGWAYVTEKGNMYVDLSNDKRVKIGSRADSAVEADRASGDKSTETIRGKYLARIKQVTSDGTQFTFRGETGDGTDAPDLVSIPLAGDKAGLISNAAQTLKGVKTFYDGISFPGVTSTTYPAKSKGLTWSGGTDGAKIYYEVKKSDEGLLVIESTDDENAGAVFRNSSSGKEVSIINGLVTGSFKGNIEGTASNAIKDNLNQTIDETYMKYPLTISGETITMVRGDGINSTITVPDTKVTQSNTNASNYRPVVLGYTNTSTIADLSKTVRNQVYVSTKFYACPSTGVFVAPEFKGKLTGKADTAGTADYAIADGDGNNIAATYVADVSKKKNNSGAISSHYVFTVTKGDGSTNDVDLHFAASASCGGAANSANTVNVIDVRGANHLPNDSIYKDKNMQFIFNNNTMPSSDWYSGMHIAGWTRTDYQSWELVSGSSTGLNGKLYYRNGKGGSWNAWKELVFTDGTVKNAQYAEKDKDGNVITTTYIATIKEVTSNGTTFTFRGYTSDNTERPNLITIPAASTTKAGLVTNAAQTWAGKKTFTGDIIISHDCVNTMTNSSTNPYIKLGNADLSQYAMIMYTSYDSYRAPGGLKILGPDPNDPIWFEVEGDLYVKRNLYDKNGDALLADRYVASFYSHTSTASTFKLGGKNYDGDVICNHQIPNASTTVAGLITAEAQDLKGNKTLDGEFYAKGNFQRLTAGQAFYRTWMPEGTAKPIGWYRIAKISRLENYANFTLYITGGWSSGAPAVAQLQIVVQNNTVRIRQTSGIAGIIDKIRIVGTSSNNDMYLEVHQSYDYVNKGGTMSTQRFYLVGHISATTYQPTTNDGSGTAVAECPVRTYDNTYVKSGTANRMAYYSATGDISSTGHYTSTSQVGINTTNTTHIGNYSLYVEDSGAGTARFSIGDNDLVADKKVVIGSPGNRYLSFGGSGVQAYDASNKASVFYINYNGGNFQVGSSSTLYSLFTLFGGLTIKGSTSSMGSVGFNYEGIGAASDDVHRVIWFAYNGRKGTPVYDNDFTYNPYIDELKVKKILISDTSASNYLKFARDNYGYILGGGGNATISINPSGNNGEAYSVLTVGQASVYSARGDILTDLGQSTKYWKNLYINNIYIKGTTKWRLMWVDGDGLVKSANHFANASKVAINYTAEPGYTFYVSGNSYVTSDSYSGGIFISNRAGTTGGGFSLRNTNSEIARIYIQTAGTTSTIGITRFNLGSSVASGSAYNSRGVMHIYGRGTSIKMSLDADTYGNIYMYKADGNNYYTNASGATATNFWHIYNSGQNFIFRTYYGGSTSAASAYRYITMFQNGGLALNSTSQTITPTGGSSTTFMFYVNGSSYTAGNIWSTASIIMNRSGTGHGFILRNQNKQYAFLGVDTVGTVATASAAGTAGVATLYLGNSTAQPAAGDTTSGANNAYGRILLYGTNAKYTIIRAQANGNRTFYLPNYAGTMYAVHAGSNSAIGNATTPVYIAANGRVTACTSYTTALDGRYVNVTGDTMTGSLTNNARLYCNEWIQFNGTTGLYFPNGNGGHFYPNTNSSYGTFQMAGTRGGYFGYLIGNSNAYMCLMDSGVHKGLYQESQGRWILYYNRDNQGLGLNGSSIWWGNAINANGSLYVSGNQYTGGYIQSGTRIFCGYDSGVTGSVSCNNWFRSSGATGWYNASYGDHVYSTGSYIQISGHTVYTPHRILSESVACSWIDGQRYNYGGYNLNNATNTGSYWPWMRQTNTASGRWFSFGILNTSFYWIGSTTSRTANSYDYGMSFNIANGYLQGCTRVYGAVWNDYAEYRETKGEIEPGRVVIETGKGDLQLSTKRLQPGANVVSDTYGFAIGETDKAKTTIAVSGRVLAYPYEDKEDYKPGDAVCTGPNGTISKMTREEIIMYPERIVGTVSEIPNYEIWGEEDVPVNGRIWIKVK